MYYQLFFALMKRNHQSLKRQEAKLLAGLNTGPTMLLDRHENTLRKLRHYPLTSTSHLLLFAIHPLADLLHCHR